MLSSEEKFNMEIDRLIEAHKRFREFLVDLKKKSQREIDKAHSGDWLVDVIREKERVVNGN